MICTECNSEMSKKWHPGTAKAMGGAIVTWACGVCGYQLLQDKTRISADRAAEPLAPSSE